MPQNIHIRSTDCNGEFLMYAKPEVAKDSKGETFKFHNHVKSTNPINIQFYRLDEKGELGKEIPGFCEEMGSTETVLTIEENMQKDCTIPASVSEKYFAYTVQNDDAETLDPVIIIDDAFVAADDGGFGLLFLLLAGAGGVIVGALGSLYFKSRSSAAS